MAIFCPIINSLVLYLECLECEDKVCKKEPKECTDEPNKETILKKAMF